MMPDSNGDIRIKFEHPGTYRIEVQGVLDESWSDRLAGMQMVTDNAKTDLPVTILIGHLRDQTQLSGVLNTLHELHFPIQLVKYVPADKDDNDFERVAVT